VIKRFLWISLILGLGLFLCSPINAKTYGTMDDTDTRINDQRLSRLSPDDKRILQNGYSDSTWWRYIGSVFSSCCTTQDMKLSKDLMSNEEKSDDAKAYYKQIGDNEAILYDVRHGRPCLTTLLHVTPYVLGTIVLGLQCRFTTSSSNLMKVVSRQDSVWMNRPWV